ncbi:GT2 family glycosyltransferase [Spirosoma oryzae]|uniref:GT2 family glycosyltransferase n=1 Tax=Spirosoma oryzae TaxID=1469603 RepID=A0A2T0SW72_9BACT|nr:glycosyltransferase family 2 protein [Spirosoma oryzae]PRY37662.1 GT2 family glycosyltransferase [Spirosoma oryzae]
MISVVIPVHNRLAYTRQCLNCLSAQTYRDFRVIVVDDGSTDGTDTMIKTEFPDVVLIKGDGNLWWTEATNVGIRYAMKQPDGNGPHFVLTLNDDTIVQPDYLQSMLNAYDVHHPCLVGSVSVDSTNPERLEYAGSAFELYTAGGRHLAADYQYSYANLIGKTDHVESQSLPGRGTLIPMDVFAKAGLFNAEKYAHYMADIEFSIRAKKAGYRLIVDAKSIVYEIVQATGIQVEKGLTFKQFINSFTSIKSPTNLTVRYNFALEHSRTKHLYFCFDIGRICAGFLLRKLRTVRLG